MTDISVSEKKLLSATSTAKIAISIELRGIQCLRLGSLDGGYRECPPKTEKAGKAGFVS
jgi:hypothetical protein